MQSRRPQPLDKGVLENLVGRLFPDVKNWLEEAGEVFSDDLEQDLFDELVDLLEKTYTANDARCGWDGYVLARELEERGWTPDGELVAILHDAEALAYSSLREEVVRWVAMNGLVPSHKVGEPIRVHTHTNEPDLMGQVAIVHPETMEYTVLLPIGSYMEIPHEKVRHGRDGG
jgi:hypothetical protein